MYPQDPIRDPCIFSTLCHTFGSLSGLTYINLICAGVLLIEAALLYILLRRQRSRWLALVPLALVISALALARHMWTLYWQVVPFPHFPPGWLDSYGDAGLNGGLTLALALAAAFFTLFMLYIIFSKDSPRDRRTQHPGYPWK